jgi:hypothetical protein
MATSTTRRSLSPSFIKSLDQFLELVQCLDLAPSRVNRIVRVSSSPVSSPFRRFMGVLRYAGVKAPDSRTGKPDRVAPWEILEVVLVKLLKR